MNCRTHNKIKVVISPESKTEQREQAWKWSKSGVLEEEEIIQEAILYDLCSLCFISAWGLKMNQGKKTEWN